jgi:outer membrane protein TolC
VARFGPGVDEQRVREAEAAFDFVAFAGARYVSTDSPQQAPFFNPTAATVSESLAIDAGLRKLLTTGGTVTLENNYEYTDNNTPNFTLSPDPASSASVALRVEQPLLRNFGREVTLAEVRLSENARRSSVQDLRDSLRRTVVDVERAYWDLRFAERDLKIRRKLLERGLEVRRVLGERLEAEFDVRPAEYSDAVATVERRRGDIISAQNRLRRASDRLKLLINDPRYPVAGEAVLLAREDVVDEPVRISLLGAMREAVSGRPEVLRAALGIGAADINLAVAENELLPDLDLLLEADYQGLDPEADEAYKEVIQGSFISTVIGLQFERALGNRRAESAFRRRRLERLRAAADYQRVARVVMDDVKGALRDLDTAYRLIGQSRVSRLAAAENLRTLLVEKELTRGLTADFLDLEFTRQQQLAQAEINEARALADYAIARAEVDAATATNLSRRGIEFVVPDAEGLLDDPRPLSPLIDRADERGG